MKRNKETMQKTQLLYVMALPVWLGLLSACSAEEPAAVASRPSEVIRFSAVTVGQDAAMTTRAMAADSLDAGLPAHSDIDVFIYGSDNNVVPSDDEENADPPVTLPMVYTTTDAADPSTARSALNLKDATLASPKYPTTDDRNAYIFAVFPAQCTTAQLQADRYTFTIKSDQTVRANITASDLLATERIEQPMTGGKSIDLNMTHRMAKLIIRFNPTGNLTEDNMPTRFDVNGILPTVIIKPKTGATAATAAAGAGSACITTDETATRITLKGRTDEALIVPPQTIPAQTTLLAFDLSGTPDDHFNAITGVTYKTASALRLEPNTVYEITVTVNADYISATTTVTPWIEEAMPFDKKIL